MSEGIDLPLYSALKPFYAPFELRYVSVIRNFIDYYGYLLSEELHSKTVNSNEKVL